MALLTLYLAVAACMCASTYAAPKFENLDGDVIISVDDATKDIQFSMGTDKSSVKDILAELAGIKVAAGKAKDALDETIKTTLEPLKKTTGDLTTTVGDNKKAADKTDSLLKTTIADLKTTKADLTTTKGDVKTTQAVYVFAAARSPTPRPPLACMVAQLSSPHTTNCKRRRATHILSARALACFCGGLLERARYIAVP